MIKPMHILDVLANIRASALSEREKGRRFELLIRAWFLANPVYAVDLSDVWLWEQFPAREEFGGHDLGIDLVARTKLGEYWAIQCKFYAQNTKIEKGAVDSFIANSSRTFRDPITGNPTSFAARFWISTSDYFNPNAMQIVRNQEIPFIKSAVKLWPKDQRYKAHTIWNFCLFNLECVGSRYIVSIQTEERRHNCPQNSLVTIETSPIVFAGSKENPFCGLVCLKHP